MQSPLWRGRHDAWDRTRRKIDPDQHERQNLHLHRNLVKLSDCFPVNSMTFLLQWIRAVFSPSQIRFQCSWRWIRSAFMSCLVWRKRLDLMERDVGGNKIRSGIGMTRNWAKEKKMWRISLNVRKCDSLIEVPHLHSRILPTSWACAIHKFRGSGEKDSWRRGDV